MARKPTGGEKPPKRKPSSTPAASKPAAAPRTAGDPPAQDQAMILHPDRLESIVTYANVAPHPLSSGVVNHIVGGKRPCICEPTGEPGACLRFWLDDDGQYGRPPEGEPVDCATCRAACR